jgi:hypothetical protein
MNLFAREDRCAAPLRLPRWHSGSWRVLRAPRATFLKAIRVPGMIAVERPAATRNEPVCPKPALRANVGPVLRKSALFGCGTLAMGLLWIDLQYKGVGALYFGPERV